MKKSFKKAKVTLGCDPELIIFKDNQAISADSLLHRSDKFGCDGHSFTAELRPDSGEMPSEVVNNIASLLYWFKEEFPDHELKAGAYQNREPIGGHIHIGGEISIKLVDNLDLVFECLKSCLEPKAQNEKRYGQYGQRKSFRRKPWGIEYRSPLSWLLSPYHAFVYLGLAKIIATYKDFNYLEIYNKTIDNALTFPITKANGKKYLKAMTKELSTIIEEDELLEVCATLDNLVNDNTKWDWENNILSYWFDDGLEIDLID